MTRHRTPPAPPRPVRTPTILLAAAAGIGSLAVVALIGTASHAATVHPVTVAEPLPSVSAWTPVTLIPRAAPEVTVTARTTAFRYTEVTPGTVTAFRTRTAVATTTATTTTTATVTAHATTTVTATVTQTVTAPAVPTAP